MFIPFKGHPPTIWPCEEGHPCCMCVIDRFVKYDALKLAAMRLRANKDNVFAWEDLFKALDELEGK